MIHLYRGYLIDVEDVNNPRICLLATHERYSSNWIPIKITTGIKPFHQAKAIVDGLVERGPLDRICLKSKVLSNGQIIVYK